jgi:hypothetical protein
MPYAYGANINHVFDTDHLQVYVTFRHPMQRSAIPQATPPVYDWYPLPVFWLLEADEVEVDIISAEWLDEHTLLLTSDTVASEPTGVTLEYAGPDEKLCTTWGKQWEPWGPKPSYAGYPTAPALHNSTHENGGADEVNIAGLSGRAADTQPSFVDRGDPEFYDWEGDALISDGDWHELDCSSIVPEGTKAILFRVACRATTIAEYIIMRKKGNINYCNIGELHPYAANTWATAEMIIACDTNKKVEYAFSVATWTGKQLTVAGWWL